MYYIPLTHVDLKKIKFASSCEIFMILFVFTDVSTVSQGKVAALNKWGGKIKKHLSVAYSLSNKYSKIAVNVDNSS